MTKKPLRQGTKPGDGTGGMAFEDLNNHYEPEEEIRCVFYTLVVRNEALKKKWKGGLKDYSEKYNAFFNDKITTTCFMGPYWDEQFAALVENGLEQNKDFILFDASNVILEKDYTPFPFRVDWLGGYVHQAGVMIFMRN